MACQLATRRLSVLLAFLGALGCGRGKDEAPERYARAITGQGIIIDPDGHPGSICIGSLGCAHGVRPPLDIPEGVHAITAPYAYDTVGENSTMGRLRVTNGELFVESDHFELIEAERRVRARTVAVTYESNGVVVPIGIHGLGYFNTQSPVRLIRNRRYVVFMAYAWSASNGSMLTHDGSATPNMELAATGTMAPIGGSLAQSYLESTATGIRAINFQDVLVDRNGVFMRAGVHGLGYADGPTPLRLFRGRRYSLFSGYAVDPATLSPFFTADGSSSPNVEILADGRVRPLAATPAAAYFESTEQATGPSLRVINFQDVTYANNGVLVKIGIHGLGQLSWTQPNRFLRNRQYILFSTYAYDPITRSPFFSVGGAASPNIEITAAGDVRTTLAGMTTNEYFEGSRGRLEARLSQIQDVIYEGGGTPENVRVLGISELRTGSAVKLFRRRNYALIGSYSQMITVPGSTYFSTEPYDFTVNSDGSLRFSGEMGQSFYSLPTSPGTLRARLGEMVVTSTGYSGTFAIRGMATGSGSGTAIRANLIVGRSYTVTPGDIRVSFPVDGACTPTTIPVSGGSLTVACQRLPETVSDCAGRAGAPCDDGIACTEGTVCSSTGVCGGGRPAADETACDAGIPGCGAGTCQAGACRLPDGGICARADGLRIAEACVVPEPDGGPGTIYWAYENTSTTETVEAQISSYNEFDDVSDRGQPKWFRPGRGVFATTLIGSDDTWTLGESSLTIRASSPPPACVFGVAAGRSNVTIAGVTYPIGIDRPGIMSSAIATTTTSPAVDGSATSYVPGSTAGALTVSHDGSANLTIPISLPPAPRALVPPAVSLSYNSNGGNGPVGVGFSLSAGGQIHRCTLHPTFGDAKPGPTEWRGAEGGGARPDALCLNGKRLFESATPNQFEVEDDPRIKVTAVAPDTFGDPTSFTVETGDGLIYRYGTTADSRVTARPMLADPSTAPATWAPSIRDYHWAWSLSEIVDSLGHQVRYSYRTVRIPGDFPGIEHDLTGIAYGGFTVEVGYQVDPQGQPVFRDDPLERYNRAMRFVQRRLVEEIRVLRGSALIKRTRLTYLPSPSTGRSRLTSIQECDRSQCKAPIRLGWQDQVSSYVGGERLLFRRPNLLPRRSHPESFAMTVADLNNDGFDDVIVRLREADSSDRWSYALSDGQKLGALTDLMIPAALMPEGQTEREKQWRRIRSVITADVDADNLPDIGVYDGALGGGFSFFGLDGSVKPSDRGVLGYVGDLNGDDLPDLVGTSEVVVSNPLFPGDYLQAHRRFWPSVRPIRETGGFFADIDGDSAAEFILRKPSAPPGAVTAFQGPWAAGAPLEEAQTAGFALGTETRNWLIDLNGDGLPEMVTAEGRVRGTSQNDLASVGRGVKPTITVNTGIGFRVTGTQYPGSARDFPESTWANGTQGNPGPVIALDDNVRVGDLNGDGRQEFLVTGEPYVCKMVEGDSAGQLCTAPEESPLHTRVPFVARLGYDNQWQFEDLNLQRSEWALDYPEVVLADIDGDGSQDIIRRSASGTGDGLQVFRRPSVKADTISSITDSLGAVTAISYKPMVSPEVHSRTDNNTNCTYPFSCPRRGQWLVSDVSYDTALGATPTRRVNHKYENARAARDGRGFLGFSAHVVTDAGRTTRYEMNNTFRSGRFYSLAGRVGRTLTRIPLESEALLIEVKTELLERRPASSGRTFVLPTSVCEKRWERSLQAAGEPGPSETPFLEKCTNFLVRDDYGFPLRIEQTGGLERKLEVLTYHRPPPASSQGNLGVVTSSTVTSELSGDSAVVTTAITPYANGLPHVVTVTPQLSQQTRSEIPVASRAVTTTYHRDGDGLPERIVVAADSGARHPLDNLTRSLPQTRETRLVHDADGYVRFTQNHLGHVEEFTYEPSLGVMVARLDANGVLHRYRYDGFGRPLGALSPIDAAGSVLGGETMVSYSAAVGDPFVVRQLRRQSGVATLAETYIHHDILGRERWRSEAMPQNRVSYTFQKYDQLGRHTGTSAPSFVLAEPATGFTEFDYDLADRVVATEDAEGRMIESRSYDGLTETITDGRRNQRVIQSDGGDLILSSSNRAFLGEMNGVPQYRTEDSVSYSYRPFGRLWRTTATRNGTQFVVQSTLDEFGRPYTSTDPDRGTTVTGYNDFGELIWNRRNSSPVESHVYDHLGRLLRRNGAHDGSSSFDYDRSSGGIGQISSARTAEGIVNGFAYDALGRSLGQTTRLASGETIGTELWYDGDRLGGVRYPPVAGRPRFEATMGYSASAGGRLVSVSGNIAGFRWLAEDFHPQGFVSQEAFGNRLRVNRVLDRAGLLSQVTAAYLSSQGLVPEPSMPPPLGTAARVQDLELQYDEAFNLRKRIDRATGVSNQVVDETYHYDALNRLEFWTVLAGTTQSRFQYHFDNYGNLRQREVLEGPGASWNFTYGGPRPHAIVSSSVGGAAATTYDHDSHGRRWRDGTRSLTFSDFDLPKQITVSSGGALLADFQYDAFGGRVRKLAGAVETLTISGLYERVSPGDDGGVKHVFRVPGPNGVLGELELVQVGSTVTTERTRYLHGDNLGSASLVSTETAGQEFRQRFEPYGGSVDPANPVVTASVPLGPRMRHGFTGHEHDRELGYVNMNGRIYSPGTASFLSADPVVAADPGSHHAFNPFGYVLNNPLTFIDPTGFAPHYAGRTERGTHRLVMDEFALWGALPAESDALSSVSPLPLPPPPPPPPPPFVAANPSSGVSQDDGRSGNPGQLTPQQKFASSLAHGHYVLSDLRARSETPPPQPQFPSPPGTVASQGAWGRFFEWFGQTQTQLHDYQLTVSEGFVNSALAVQELAEPIEQVVPVAGTVSSKVKRKALGELAEAAKHLRTKGRFATRGNLVIGKVGDLTKAGALREGERTLLPQLPNLGSPKANWAQNSGRLREAMREGVPIRDATVDSAGALINNTGFLRAERYLLETRNWVYNQGTTMWHPPLAP